MLFIFRYIKGYLTVLFCGEFSEKILNLAAMHRISLWDSHLTKKGIESCISVSDFRKLRYIIRKSGIKVHIKEKRGLPFKINYNRKRSGLLLGFCLALIFLKIMSSYIWVIDVKGNNKVSEQEILSVCDEIGINAGIKSRSVNTKTQRERMLLKIEGLAWASLNIEGCKLTVNVTETKKEKQDKSSPSNLKAKADGIIKKIDITSGNCIVKTGDTVKTGDVLVSGIIENADGTHFVTSQGTVTAITERSITVDGDFIENKLCENGKIKRKSVLEFFSIKIPLFLGAETEPYNQSFETKTATLFGQKLPIKLYTKEFKFKQNYKKVYSKESLTEKLFETVKKQLKEENVDNYNITDYKITEKKDSLSLNAIISAEENIAYSENILFS